MDGTNGSLVPVLMLYLLFLLAEGAMFGFGAAIQNLNDAELLHAPADEGRKQRIRKIMDQPGAFIESTQILTFLGGLVFGLLLTPPLSGAFGRLLAERLPGGAGSLAGILAALLSVLLLVLFTLTFGIDLPKRLAERKSVPWALGCLGPVRLLMALLLPLRLPVRLVCRPLMRLLGIDPALIEANGAVSFPVAKEMAERVRALTGAEIGVGVTGLAGPDGDGVHPVGTVFVSLAVEGQTWVKELRLGEKRTRSFIRRMAGNHIFDMMRRWLTGLPVLPED